MIDHLPVNHRLRGLYRGLSGLSGLYLVVFGVVGYLQTSGNDFFDPSGERVLGLTTNPAFSVASIVLGALVVLSAVIGRNITVVGHMALGTLMVIGGIVMLFLIPSDDSNVVAASVTNVVVSFVLGMVILAAGLYGRVDSGAASSAH